MKNNDLNRVLAVYDQQVVGQNLRAFINKAVIKKHVAKFKTHANHHAFALSSRLRNTGEFN